VNREEEIRQKFGRIWPAHVSSLARFLIECRKTFDGDLDMFLVLVVIGDSTFSQRNADPRLDFDRFHAPRSLTPPEDINIRSIADFSGIPRETVRRKVAQLAEKGWVTRKEDGFVVATEKAKQELMPLTQASVKYLARMMAVLREG
jgi:DNA-binding MarR family transcriptional regulator